MADTLLEAEDLTIKYRIPNGHVTAASEVSFRIKEDQYLGLVGESGCGKSTIAKAIMGGLDDNGEITSGKLYYKGKEIQHLSQQELNEQIRWKEIAFIPQNSMRSLNPIQKISNQAIEIMQVHTDADEEEAIDRLSELFDIVGLQQERIYDYPFEFSGGMAQRATIAMSLLLEPSLIIADEPTTALDVIMQDQIFKYMEEMRDVTDASLLLITHDIAVVFELCDSIIIMYAGNVAEKGSVSDLYHSPRHPYSILLQQSFPDFEHPEKDLVDIPGHPPKLMGEVEQCVFADRCPWVVDHCYESVPPLESLSDGKEVQEVACFRKDEINREEINEIIAPERE